MDVTNTPLAIRQCALLNISIGEAMMVDLVGVGASFKTTFVGMVRCKLVIVRMPHAPELREHIYQGKLVMVKYLAKGEIDVFKTAVASVGFKPIPLLFLDYPTKVDTLKLRKAERVECRFPARLAVGGRELAGSVTDLSLDGCRVALAAKGLEGAGLPAAGATAAVAFAFFSLNYDFTVKATVMNVHAGASVSVGLRFEALDEGMRTTLEEYFHLASAAMPGE